MPPRASPPAAITTNCRGPSGVITAHRRNKPHGAGFGGVWIARGLDAHLTSDHNARRRLTHRMAERAQAASAMRKLQFFRASLGTPWPVGRQ